MDAHEYITPLQAERDRELATCVERVESEYMCVLPHMRQMELRELLVAFGLHQTLEAIEIATKYLVPNNAGRFTDASVHHALTKIGGIAYNRAQREAAR